MSGGQGNSVSMATVVRDAASVTVGLLSIGGRLDLFDFFIVGYLVAQLGPQWHLTYGESSVMLLAGGAGAIVSALCWGALSDALGRKRSGANQKFGIPFGVDVVGDGSDVIGLAHRLAQ